MILLDAVSSNSGLDGSLLSKKALQMNLTTAITTIWKP